MVLSMITQGERRVAELDRLSSESVHNQPGQATDNEDVPYPGQT